MAGRIIAGIDVGSTKVVAAIAVVEDDNTPRVIGEASYPAQGIKKGDITGIEEATSSIHSALTAAERMAGLTVSSVYVTINGKHIISNNNKGVVAISDTDSEIIYDDVLRAMEQAKTVAIPAAREIIHLIPREFIVDGQMGIKDPAGMTGRRLEVDAHIISATNTALHNLRKCIQGIGLRIDGEVFTGWASAQSVLTNTERELGVLLLDFGGGTTSITTYEDNAVTYSASIPFGGANVTRDLAAGLRMSLDDAEKVKLNVERMIKEAGRGTKKDNAKEVEEDKERDILDVTDLDIEGQKTISRKFFNSIVSERVEEIFELVRENVVQAGYDYKLPAGVVITGGSAELPGITTIAKKVFGVPARVGHPRGLDGLIDGISTPGYAAIQGLLLHALSTEEYAQVSKGGTSFGTGNEKGLFSQAAGFFKKFMP
jgi:cell division protein FtsA